MGGTITNNRSKKKIAFRKRGGVYILEVLVAPGPRQSASADGLMTGGPMRESVSADAPKRARASGFTRQGACVLTP